MTLSSTLLAVGGATAVVGAALLGVVVGVREVPYRLARADNDTCIGCHAERQPRMVQQWRDSRHFAVGVDCEDCHGADHDAMFAQGGEVSAAACGERCHNDQYVAFGKSKHSRPMTGAKADALPHYPDSTGGCSFARGCHAVRKEYPDGSRGKCSVCHPSHGFSLSVTRDPSVCVTCHSGTHNTEVEEYEKSIHGVLQRVGAPEDGGPTCVTCHMRDGDHNDGKAMTDLVESDLAVRPGDASLRFVRTMSKADFDERREQMLQACDPCHGRKLSSRALSEADAFRRKGALMLEEGAQVVHELYDEGLLRPMPERRDRNPMGEGLQLGSSQLFDETMSAAERIFYEMYMFTYSGAWRRAYHNSPPLVRWHENEMLKGDLIRLRAEADRLRQAAEREPERPAPPPLEPDGEVPRVRNSDQAWPVAPPLTRPLE